MESKENVTLPPPPGLIASLTAGFDAVANHITVILLPIALDVLLWFGPHLRIESIMRPVIAQWADIPKNSGISLPADAIQQSQQLWTLLVGRFNLLAFLRTFPIGIPSLLALQLPMAIPIGRPGMLELPSFASAAGWVAMLGLVGWTAGGLYFHWVAQVTFKRKDDAPAAKLGWAVVQALLLSVTWLTLIVIVSIPLLVILSIVALISPSVGQVLSVVIAILILWTLLPIYFSPHGIFTYGQNAFASILQSLRMVRFTFPSTGVFVLACILISEGLAFLWRTPPETSWFMLIGIIGHAFISTALLASSFIYYRDMNSWLQVMLERFKTQATSARA